MDFEYRRQRFSVVAKRKASHCIKQLMAAMKFTHAIVCRIPQSFRTKCDVNLDEARKQHEIFVKLLRELGLDVIELPPDENLPESVYVEDTAIVLNGSVLITRPETGRLKEVSVFFFFFKQISCFLRSSFQKTLLM